MTHASNPDRASSQSTLNRLVLRFLAAMTVVVLLFGPYLARILTRPVTRYHFMWQTRDAVYLLASIVACASLCMLIGEFVRWLGRPRLTRAFAHVFVLALGAGILANIGAFASEYFGIDYNTPFARIEMQIGWVLLLGIVAWSYRRGGTTLVLRARQLCQVLSPTVLLIAVQLFTFEEYSERRDALSLSPRALCGSNMRVRQVHNASPAHPVYVLVFDEWSYRRTFEGLAISPELVNLRRLAAESLVFHDARSPDEWTHGSMPKLLFQTDLPVVWGEGREGFEKAGEFVPSREFVSWFERPALAQHQAVLLGFHLPYDAWLGDQVDTYRVYRWYERGETPSDRFGLQFLEAARYWTDPISDALYDPIRLRVDDRHVLRLRAHLKEDLLSIVRQGRDDVAVIWHYPLPHFPFISDSDGTYRGPDEVAWKRDDAGGYRRNLVQLDTFLGELIQEMKQAGQYDDAMLIVTSDHNWRYDPARTARPHEKDPLTHVPLVIKLPGVSAHQDVTETFENRDLWRLVAAAIQSGQEAETPTQRVADWLNDRGLSNGGLAAVACDPHARLED